MSLLYTRKALSFILDEIVSFSLCLARLKEYLNISCMNNISIKTLKILSAICHTCDLSATNHKIAFHTCGQNRHYKSRLLTCRSCDY